MKLSEVLGKYLLTSVSEGTHLVEVDHRFEGLLELSYTDEAGLTYSGSFEDQEVTWTRGNEFVVSCDGAPWTFAAWEPVRGAA